MKLIVCIDDNNGMAFHSRRQSSDRKVLLKIEELVKSKKVWVHPYSQRLLGNIDADICVDSHFLEVASGEDFCFAEVTDVTTCFSKMDEIVIFRWNRKYPADLHFPMQLLSECWKMTSSFTFTGNSHTEITQETYLKC